MLIHILRCQLKPVILILILFGLFFNLVIQCELPIYLVSITSLDHFDSQVQWIYVKSKFFIACVMIKEVDQGDHGYRAREVVRTETSSAHIHPGPIKESP